MIVEMDGEGQVHIEKRLLRPRRDMRKVAAAVEELESHPISEDYVFVTLLNENPVLFPMEKVRAVYPNALHVERRMTPLEQGADVEHGQAMRRAQSDPVSLFASFYKEIKGTELTEGKHKLFAEAYMELLKGEGGAV